MSLSRVAPTNGGGTGHGMALINSNGTAVTKAALQSAASIVPQETVYALGADVYATFFLPGENTANGPGGRRLQARAGEYKTQTQIDAYYPAPTVNSVTPASGSHLGGTAVVIKGSNLTYGASATFGGTAAIAVVVNEYGTELSCTTPAHAVGAVDVVVNNGNDTDTLDDGFLYT